MSCFTSSFLAPGKILLRWLVKALNFWIVDWRDNIHKRRVRGDGNYRALLRITTWGVKFLGKQWRRRTSHLGNRSHKKRQLLQSLSPSSESFCFHKKRSTMMLHFYYESILHELQKGSIFRRGFLCFHGRLFTIVFLVALLLLGINFIYTRGAVCRD